MHTTILVALVVLSLATATGNALAAPQSERYHAPAHNYYQNNWMNA